MIPYDAIAGRKYQDVRRRVPDTAKASSVLGFVAKTSLDEGLKTTIAWQRPFVTTSAACTVDTEVSQVTHA